MIFTPHMIAEYLVPWVLVVLAYPLVLISLRRLAVSAPHVVASMDTGGRPYSGEHRRPYTSRDVVDTILVAAAGWALVSAISSALPTRAEWWSEPLRSGWETSYGLATVLDAFALPLVSIVVALAALTLLMMLVSWLAEPIEDGAVDDPQALLPNRFHTMGRALATWWGTRRRIAVDAGHN